MSSPAPPTPDLESEPFWSGLREHRLIVQQCSGCGRRRFPRMPACPYCGTEGGADVETAGSGRVYSWVRVDRALTPDMSEEVPYCIATVDLDGGGRLFGRLEPPGAAAIGLAVVAVYVEREGWTELRFRPAEAPGAEGAAG